MTNKNIAKTAGSIWHTLGEKGRVNIIQLPRLLHQKTQLTYMALGWLAREDKIKYITKNGRTYVSLTPVENNIFENVSAAKV